DLPDPAREALLEHGVLLPELRVRVPPLVQVVDGVDPGLEQLLRTAEARAHGRVEDRALDRDPEASGAQQRVLFGVHADADIVPRRRAVLLAVRAPLAAPLVAVRHPLRRAVVACRDDAVVQDEDGAHAVAHTVRTPTDRERDPHIVVHPIRPRPFDLFTHRSLRCGLRRSLLKIGPVPSEWYTPAPRLAHR